MLNEMGHDARKPVFGVVNSKGAGQPVHPCRLISAFALESIISKFPIGEICSCGDWFESCFIRNPEERFCPDEAQIMSVKICVSMEACQKKIQIVFKILMVK